MYASCDLLEKDSNNIHIIGKRNNPQLSPLTLALTIQQSTTLCVQDADAEHYLQQSSCTQNSGSRPSGTMVSQIKLAILAITAPSVLSFAPASVNNIARTATVQYAKGQSDEKAWSVDESKQMPTAPDGFQFPNPFAEILDIFQNFDDVVDDFFNKRMGNGEIFYGKRKYKPSGNVDSEYNGGGFSDWRKIEAAREFREERARLREEEKAKDNVKS